MKARRTVRAAIARRGVTWIEVLVVIVVSGLVVALLLPAICSSKVTSRRLQCLNNLNNLGVAVVNYQSHNDDKLPLLVSRSQEGDAVDGWPIQLLPLLDSAAMYRAIRDDRQSIIDPATGLPKVNARFFTCPEDINNFRVEGGLSYAANAGYMTAAVWGNPAADESLGLASAHAAGSIAFDDAADFEERVARHFATGVFWRPVTAPQDPSQPESSRQDAPRMTGDFIARGDGLSQTLLFAENVHSRNWASSNVNDIAFGLSVPTTAAGDPDRFHASGKIGGPEGPLAMLAGWSLAQPGGHDAAINALVKSAKPGAAPRPSSYHAGNMINVCFVDGHAISVSDQIDPTVYARLLTPAGETHGQAKVEPDSVE